MKNRKRGFTLIELLVVVLIIGILAAVALPQYIKAVRKARMVQIQVLCRAMAEAEIRYYMENGEFTKDFSALDIDLPGGAVLSSTKENATLGKYKFQIWIQASSGTLGTVIGSIDGLTFLQDFRPQKLSSRQCRTRPDNATNISICKSMGGVYTGTYGGVESYRLP